MELRKRILNFSNISPRTHNIKHIPNYTKHSPISESNTSSNNNNNNNIY